MKILVSIITLFFLASCGAPTKDIALGKNKVTRKGVVSIMGTELRDKTKKWDVSLVVKNEHQGSIIIFFHDIQCARGNTNGVTKHRMKWGERTIDFTRGQSKDIGILCDRNPGESDQFSVTVGYVYDNPNNDGKTTGKVLAKDVVWKSKP